MAMTRSLWLTAYVTDFLLRAREKGYEVPEDVLVGGLDYIRNMVGNAPDIEQGAGQDMAYALYVLARAGRAPVGDLKYLADTKLKDFGSPLARAQVAAALAMLGDRERADTAFAAAIEALAEMSNAPHRGGTVPTTAACCAMPRRSWHSRPMPRPSPKSSAPP